MPALANAYTGTSYVNAGSLNVQIPGALGAIATQACSGSP